MPEILYAEATLTERYQNTIPAVVRKALHLKKGDQVRYAISDTGEVKLSRVGSEQADPVIEQFLNFLANDLQQHPNRLQSITPYLRSRIDALVGDINIDLDAPLSEENE